MRARRPFPVKPEHGRVAGHRSNPAHACGGGVYVLGQQDIDDLSRAQRLLYHCDVCPYLELKELLDSRRGDGQARFRSLFARYYGLDAVPRTDAFKDEFFRILRETRNPKHAQVIRDLRKSGSHGLEFSFVSKLVTMHDESSPIVDKHVLGFFKERLPPAAMSEKERIARYEELLSYIKASYVKWAESSSVRAILNKLKRLDRRLCQCHDVRLIDFLVLKVGRERQTRGKSGTRTRGSHPT